MWWKGICRSDDSPDSTQVFLGDPPCHCLLPLCLRRWSLVLLFLTQTAVFSDRGREEDTVFGGEIRVAYSLLPKSQDVRSQVRWCKRSHVDALWAFMTCVIHRNWDDNIGILKGDSWEVCPLAHHAAKYTCMLTCMHTHSHKNKYTDHN